MPIEPIEKRAVAFFDGQNFFRCAKTAFNLSYPNFDAIKLAEEICLEQNWLLKQVRFYTGVPDEHKDKHWHYFWTSKTRSMLRQQAKVVTRPLRYHEVKIECSDGSVKTHEYKVEKGIDVRIALDIIKLGQTKEYDVCLIFSQDQDLSEVASDIRDIAREQGRWVKLASAFPYSSTYSNTRGINNTDWIKIDQILYDRCIDPNDHRRPQSR